MKTVIVVTLLWVAIVGIAVLQGYTDAKLAAAERERCEAAGGAYLRGVCREGCKP